MKSSIDNLIQGLEDLEQQRQSLISQIKEIATGTMKEVAEENNPDIIQKIGPRCFTVKASSLWEKGWSPVTHNWEESLPIVLGFLEKHPVQKWKEILSKKVKESKGKVVYISDRIYTTGAIRCYRDTKYAIDKLFLEKIVEKL